MTRGFASVGYVAAIAGAALSCYLVSLRVAAERAQLEEVENRIVLAQRDIRLLQTEIGTRGRLAQLERWNVKVLALSAPKAEQFLDGGYQLARLARPSDEVKIDAPVVMASAPKPQPKLPVADKDDGDLPPRAEPVAEPPRPATRNDGPASLMHVASYRVVAPDEAKPKAVPLPPAAKPTVSPPTKPAKIATTGEKARLPAAPADAKAHREPAKTGASRDNGTTR